jgi:hypothetical protein
VGTLSFDFRRKLSFYINHRVQEFTIDQIFIFWIYLNWMVERRGFFLRMLEMIAKIIDIIIPFIKLARNFENLVIMKMEIITIIINFYKNPLKNCALLYEKIRVIAHFLINF